MITAFSRNTRTPPPCVHNSRDSPKPPAAHTASPTAAAPRSLTLATRRRLEPQLAARLLPRLRADPPHIPLDHVIAPLVARVTGGTGAPPTNPSDNRIRSVRGPERGSPPLAGREGRRAPTSGHQPPPNASLRTADPKIPADCRGPPCSKAGCVSLVHHFPLSGEQRLLWTRPGDQSWRTLGQAPRWPFFQSRVGHFGRPKVGLPVQSPRDGRDGRVGRRTGQLAAAGTGSPRAASGYDAGTAGPAVIPGSAEPEPSMRLFPQACVGRRPAGACLFPRYLDGWPACVYQLVASIRGSRRHGLRGSGDAGRSRRPQALLARATWLRKTRSGPARRRAGARPHDRVGPFTPCVMSRDSRWLPPASLVQVSRSRAMPVGTGAAAAFRDGVGTRCGCEGRRAVRPEPT